MLLRSADRLPAIQGDVVHRPVPALSEDLVAFGLGHDPHRQLANRFQGRDPQGPAQRVHRAECFVRLRPQQVQEGFLRQPWLEGVEAADAQKAREEHRRGRLPGRHSRILPVVLHPLKPLTKVVDLPAIGDDLTETTSPKLWAEQWFAGRLGVRLYSPLSLRPRRLGGGRGLSFG